jgi:AcrR family transcriptional regulator
VAGATLGGVKAAGVSGSLMYHCFPGRDEFVQAIISYQAGVSVDDTMALLVTRRLMRRLEEMGWRIGSGLG